MTHILKSRFRARRRLRSYRPQVLALEDRLPPGAAWLGAVLGSSLLGPGLSDPGADWAVVGGGAERLPEPDGMASPVPLRERERDHPHAARAPAPGEGGQTNIRS